MDRRHNYYRTNIEFTRFCCVDRYRIAICGNGAYDVLPYLEVPQIQRQAVIEVVYTLYLEQLFRRASYLSTKITFATAIGESTKTSKMLLNQESMHSKAQTILSIK